MFREGGFGMYPTLGLGLWAISEAIRGRGAATALAAATLIAGCLGTVTGLVKTMTYAAPYPIEEMFRFVFLGASESLQNLVLALILLVLVALAHSVFLLRRNKAD